MVSDLKRLATITAECGRLIDEAGPSGIARVDILAGIRKIIPDATEAEVSRTVGEVCRMPMTVTMKDGVVATPDMKRRLEAARTPNEVLAALSEVMEFNGATVLGEIVESA